MTDKIMLPVLLFVISMVLVFYRENDNKSKTKTIKIIKKTGGLIIIVIDICLVVANVMGIGFIAD